MAAVGMRRELAGLRAPFTDRSKTLTMMTGFRLAIVGAALTLFGGAWVAQIAWLMWLALIIGAGELIESSMMISGMRMGEGLRAKQLRKRSVR